MDRSTKGLSVEIKWNDVVEYRVNIILTPSYHGVPANAVTNVHRPTRWKFQKSSINCNKQGDENLATNAQN
jgi:hypothetical protein